MNGSFEKPNIGRGTFSVRSSIPGWTKKSSPGFELQDNVAGSPFAGNQHVELDGYSPAGLVQDVPTIPGQRYELRFAFSPRPGTPGADNILMISWNGAEVATLSASGAGLSNTNWTEYTFEVIAAPGGDEPPGVHGPGRRQQSRNVHRRCVSRPAL